MIHRVSREATFVFSTSAAAVGTGQKTGTKDQEILASGSTSLAREDFRQLLKAVFSTNWPPVVQDEHCQMPSAVGEDYSGPKCTGTFLDAPGLPEEPREAGNGEDYAAGSNFSRVVGEHLTVSVRLHLLPADSGPRADGGN